MSVSLVQVFPQLYLPVMAESYKRSLQPWRMYMPTQSWWQYRSRMGQLDAYVKGQLRERWQQRQDGLRCEQHQDIADLLMSAIEVHHSHLRRQVHLVSITLHRCPAPAEQSRLMMLAILDCHAGMRGFGLLADLLYSPSAICSSGFRIQSHHVSHEGWQLPLF